MALHAHRSPTDQHAGVMNQYAEMACEALEGIVTPVKKIAVSSKTRTVGLPDSGKGKVARTTSVRGARGGARGRGKVVAATPKNSVKGKV